MIVKNPWTYLSHICRSELLWKPDFTEKPGILIDLNNYHKNILWKGIFKIILENLQTNFEVGSNLNLKRALGWLSHLLFGFCHMLQHWVLLFFSVLVKHQPRHIVIQRKDGSSALLTVPFQLHLHILKRCENNIKAKVPDENSSFYKFTYVKLTCALEDNWYTEKNQSVGSRQLIHRLLGTSHYVLSKVYTQVIQFKENSFKPSVYGQSHPQIPKYHCGNVIPQSKLM